MARFRFVGIAVAAMIMISCGGAVRAQVAEEASPVVTEAVPSGTEGDAGGMAIYGEVMAVDPAAGSVDIQYYDYDTDSEKTLKLMMGKDLKIENADSLASVKKGDWADVTYETKDGNNIAKSVAIDKEDTEAEAETIEAVESGPGE